MCEQPRSLSPVLYLKTMQEAMRKYQEQPDGLRDQAALTLADEDIKEVIRKSFEIRDSQQAIWPADLDAGIAITSVEEEALGNANSHKTLSGKHSMRAKDSCILVLSTRIRRDALILRISAGMSLYGFVSKSSSL